MGGGCRLCVVLQPPPPDDDVPPAPWGNNFSNEGAERTIPKKGLEDRELGREFGRLGELGWALFWVVGETPRTTLPPGGVAIVVGVGILGGRDVVVVVGVGILGGRRDNMI